MAFVVTILKLFITLKSQIVIIINMKSYYREGSTTGAGNDAHQMKEEFGSEGVPIGMGGSSGFGLDRGARGMVGGHESTSKTCAKGIERPKHLLSMNLIKL